MRPPRERISVSASARGIDTWRLPGEARRERAVDLDAVDPRRAGRSSRRSRSARDALRLAGRQRRGGQTRAAAPRPTIPGTLSVPERRPFSCPPPSICALEPQARLARLADVERAHALGAVHLVRGEAQQVDAPGLDVHRDAARTPARRRCGTMMPRSRQSAADLGDGLQRCRSRCSPPSRRRGSCPARSAAAIASADTMPPAVHAGRASPRSPRARGCGRARGRRHARSRGHDEVARRPPARATPRTARLLDSVAPEVKTMSARRRADERRHLRRAPAARRGPPPRRRHAGGWTGCRSAR